MAKVNGIGGLFFRSKDPKALAAWYQKHFGIGGDDELFNQLAGPTVFAPFRADSDYFAADKQWMLNLRTDDLDGLVAALEAEGVEVSQRVEEEYGRFARVYDPEGNAIELWEPPEGDMP